MSAFADLARFYDAVYANKDYAAEAAYVARLLGTYGHNPHSLLELGAGTGRLAVELARGGHRVLGIDASNDMVERANERGRQLGMEEISFLTADATRFRAEQRFDAVIACFHVLNYMATPQALTAAFVTAAAHLEPGGLFLFDSWHGPAVRAQGPETRVRDLVVGDTPIVRIAEPHHDPERQTVDVRYRFFIQSPPTKAWELIEETHHLRYLFREDIVAACRDAGFELVQEEAWLSGAPLDDQTWGACHVARRI
jgi:ubiquinone/menaquinone biosynthesis C-methylase UbiE